MSFPSYPVEEALVVVSGCERGLQNSSYPYDEFEREPGGIEATPEESPEQRALLSSWRFL
ncbi:hypothetical protein ACFOPS_08170 [Ralstonia solanacearum]|uniref:hypothetical protein n=1 Tax=Ralstonia solanacearum TaxID=305 RepID=UPI00361879EA